MSLFDVFVVIHPREKEVMVMGLLGRRKGEEGRERKGEENLYGGERFWMFFWMFFSFLS